MKTRSFGKAHHSVDHVVLGCTERFDSLVTGARGVVHNHIDVRWGQTFLRKSFLITTVSFLSIGSGLVVLSVLDSLLSELLRLSLLHAGVLVLVLEVAEDGE